MGPHCSFPVPYESLVESYIVRQEGLDKEMELLNVSGDRTKESSEQPWIGRIHGPKAGCAAFASGGVLHLAGTAPHLSAASAGLSMAVRTKISHFQFLSFAKK